MKFLKQLSLVTVLISCLALSAFADNGVQVTQKNTSKSDPAGNGTTTISFTKDMIAISSKTASSHNMFVFDANKQLLTNADFKQGILVEVSADDVAKLGGVHQQVQPQMNQYQDLIKQKMAEAKQNMSEEDRKKFEEGMKQYGGSIPGMDASAFGGAEPEKTKYQKMGSGVTVGNWTNASHYVGSTGGQKTDEVWTVPLSAIDISQSDMVIFEKMAEFMGKMGGDASEKMKASFKVGSPEFEAEQGYSGMPVKDISYLYGNVDAVNEITEVKKTNLDMAAFTIPNREKLKKQKLFDGMQKGMSR